MPRDHIPSASVIGAELASILQGDALERLWAKHYVTKTNENPAPKIAAFIRGLPDDAGAWNEALADRPDIPAFLREIVDIERSTAQRDKDQDRVATLAGLAAFLEGVQPQKVPMPKKLLPEAQRSFIKMLENETAHNNNPFKNACHTTASFGRHLAHEVSEHRYTVFPSALLGASAAWLLTANLGTTKATYMPTGYSTIVSDPHTSDELPDFGSIEELEAYAASLPPLEIDESNHDPNFKGGCDNHLAYIVKDEKLLNTLMDWNVDKFLGTHCMKPDNIMQKGQDALIAYNERIDWVISNPTLSFSSKFLEPGTTFTNTYNDAVEMHSNAIKVANTVENFTLHTSIPAGTHSVSFSLIWNLMIAKFLKDRQAKAKTKNKQPGFLGRQWGKATAPLKRSWRAASEATGDYILRKTYGVSPDFGDKLKGFSEKRQAYAAYKAQFCGHDHDEGWCNTAKSVRDFMHRTLRNNWLSYGAATATATSVALNDYFWNAATGLNPDMVWMGAGAALAGNSVHKLHKYFTRASHSAAVISKDAVNALSEKLAHLADQAPEIKHKVSVLRDVFKPAAIGTVTAGALVALDNQLTGGVYSAHAAALLSTWGPFMAINPIEDTSWHLGLGAAGGVAGATTGLVSAGTYIGGRKVYGALRPAV